VPSLLAFQSAGLNSLDTVLSSCECDSRRQAVVPAEGVTMGEQGDNERYDRNELARLWKLSYRELVLAARGSGSASTGS